MNTIQSRIPSAGREMRRDEAEMEEPTNGKKEPDTETTTELFHRYAPALFAYLRQHTASREDAEDLLHEVFAATLERPEFGQLSDDEQALWLWRVENGRLIATSKRDFQTPKDQSVDTALKAITLHSHQIYTQPGYGTAEVYWNGQLVATLHFVVTQSPQKPQK